ncbi:MAG TPA: protein kinase [Solirubrobacteraceae bacterium]|nr:protein kinase [Solirubrobacteraceae bacterium]
MTAAALEPGTLFQARYRIEGLIGSGGMGVVYRVYDTVLERVVALKVMTPALAGDPQFRARFARESRHAGAVVHPNVVGVFDVGEEDGQLYLVMAYVDGASLDALIAQGPLPPHRVADILTQVATGLQAAHELGLVHRDIKPGNILIDKLDVAYITDFGLAVAVADRATITQTGDFAGSLDFVAPERIQGSTGDAAADIYALGCVLYTALTGRVPFPRDSHAATLFAHVSDPPPRPSAINPALAPFDVVVARAMEKRPEQRHRSAQDFATELAGAVDAPTIVPAPTPPPPPAATDDFETLPPAMYMPVPEPPAPQSAPRGWRWPRFRIRWRRPEPPPEPPALNGGGTMIVRRPTTDSLAEARRRIEAVRLPLSESFRYVHHPFGAEEDGLPLLGNEPVVLALVERILHSNGGAFMLTGFRGVGKTTVILNAIDELRSQLGSDAVVPVFLNVARPKTTEELLFEVIRRLYEALDDNGVLKKLPEDIQRRLILAYRRTSLSFSQTSGSASERAGGIGIGIPLLEALGPKVELSSKSTESLAMEASFLAYSAADVEHDFLRIVSLFRQRDETREHWDGKVVVVIDELDKLTATDVGTDSLDNLVSGLKNLLTTWGVHFVFIAGPDMHDRSLRQRHRGNSVYDSVFGWQLYVPCVWEATDRLLAGVLPPGWEEQVEFRSLPDYLRFKARGVPRLLLMELNALVEWHDGTPCVVLRAADRKRVEFYAGIERVLASFTGTSLDGHSFSVAIDEDRWRIGAYYVTDWILRTLGRTFTVEDLIPKEGEVALDPLLVLDGEKVEELLEHLVTNEIVVRVRGHGADERHFGDVPEAQVAIYKVADDVGAKLREFARENVHERADLLADADDAAIAAQPWGQTRAGEMVGNGRYLLHEEIDRGGMGRVYVATDRQRGTEVAVKLLDVSGRGGDDVMRARFLRKARIALELHHPNIVETLELLTEDEHRPGIVMEFVKGTSLQQLLRQVRFAPKDAVFVARGLLDALRYLSSSGIVRLDIKPSGIVVEPEFRPIIVDLGLAKRVEPDAAEPPITVTSDQLIGTPAYLAPEIVAGGRVDIRADVYTVGLLLFEMLTGRPARRQGELFEVLKAATTEEIDLSDLPVSQALRDAMRLMLARDPGARWSPEHAAYNLAQTPEGGLLPEPSA